MKYRILLDDEPVGATDWPPVAQAAWDRAARDRDAAQHGGEAVLMVDGQIVASVQPRTLDGHPWPVRGDHVTDLRGAAKAVIALARAAGVDAQALAQAMTDSGLHTTPARLKNISTMEQGRRSATSPAEIVAMCYAAVSVIKSRAPAHVHEPTDGPLPRVDYGLHR